MKTGYPVGRPKNGEVRQPKQKSERGPGRPGYRGQIKKGSYSLGKEYIALLETIAEQQQLSKSAVIRECINRLANRFMLPSATYEGEDYGFSPGVGEGNDITVTLGESFSNLISQMGKIRDDADTKFASKAMRGGKTQLLREELDRYAVELKFEPVSTPIDRVMAG